MIPVLDAHGVSFAYQRTPVLADVSLRVEDGGVLALVGPNGSGKTTLLKLLLGLLKPSAGTVRLRGKNLAGLRLRELARELSYVPQAHREAFGHRVVDVVLMGRMPHTSFFARYGAADRRIAGDALEKLGISHLADRPYTEVSGGERQLTLIARALAQGTRTFLLDEPTNGLDYGNQVRLLERILDLSREGFTFVLSTHHPDHALAVADRMVMMRQGRVVRDGPTAHVVTEESLAEIYGVDVRLCHVAEGVPVCVPSARFQPRNP